MLDYLFMSIYIDKNRDMIFVAEKEDEEGLVKASEPYMHVGCAEWEKVSVALIQENFLKAYADALQYLKETGSEL